MPTLTMSRLDSGSMSDTTDVTESTEIHAKAERAETTVERRQRFEREALPFMDQLYAAAMRMLSRLAPVRGVAVDEVTPEAVSFLVNVRGDPESLRQAILRDGRLLAVDASRLIYAMSP